MRKIALPGKNRVYSVRYSSFGGIDLTNLPGDTSPKRSNDCLNVYKDHSDSGDFIRTRKGLRKIFSNECALFDPGDVNGMIYFDGKIYLHFGGYLLEYTDFPSEVTFTVPRNEALTGLKIVGSAMNTSRSEWFVFMDNLYILDGSGYRMLSKDGYFGRVTSKDPYIPTTRINSDPNGGNGVAYQEENLLTPYRINGFLSDGESVTYTLDCKDYQPGSVRAEVNGKMLVAGEDFTENPGDGTVRFSVPPEAGVTPGRDNVFITFAAGDDRSDLINKCTVARVFDNRVFLTGNEDYPGVIFHSEFENATYFAVNSYYDDGGDGFAVKALLSAANALVAVKDNDTNGAKVFIHTPSIDYELGKVYPVSNTPVNLGAVGGGINFNDEMLYLSPYGFEALKISSNAVSLSHRSSLIDGKLRSFPKESLMDAKMVAWNGYLVVLIDGEVFLADSMCMNNVDFVMQYEWFHWKFAADERIVNVFSVKDGLYFAGENGNLYMYDGYTDGGNIFESFWATPKDTLGSEVLLKSAGRKGGFIRCRCIDGGAVSVSVDTDKSPSKDVGTFAIGNFSFSEGKTDFSLFTFFTSRDCFINIKPDAKRFRSICFRISSVNGRPFALGEIKAEFTVKEYDK